MTKAPILFGIENPLLDISAVVPTELLSKYNLKPNDAILAQPEHLNIYKELEQYDCVYIAGGAAQNTMRGAQWMMPPNSTVYVGAVGRDKNARLFSKTQMKVNSQNSRTYFQKT